MKGLKSGVLNRVARLGAATLAAALLAGCESKGEARCAALWDKVSYMSAVQQTDRSVFVQKCGQRLSPVIESCSQFVPGTDAAKKCDQEVERALGDISTQLIFRR